MFHRRFLCQHGETPEETLPSRFDANRMQTKKLVVRSIAEAAFIIKTNNTIQDGKIGFF